jgi:hypothetical protein
MLKPIKPKRISDQVFDHRITRNKLRLLMAEGASPEGREQAAAIAQKTMDVSQFLVDQWGVGRVEMRGGKKCREAQRSCPANSRQHSALVVQKEGYAESH